MLHLDAASHNASAVQAATEAMLAAGFGFGGGGGGEDEAGGGMIGGGANMAAQLALATAHTATAASSLSALPSSAFFAALQSGEGVDALDLIGPPQWRHALVMDSRHECQEFLIRWAGWDAKWDEWVHCLRLAPAHSKVLGDTGPEDSSEKTLVAVLGGEWLQMRRAAPHPRALHADVRITIDGKAPWSILQQQQSQSQERETQQYGLARGSPPPARTQRGAPASVPRHFASATPPHSSAASHHASLDDDDDDSAFSLDGSTNLPQQRATRYAHDAFLRVRCPRLFKYERSASEAAASAAAWGGSAVASSPGADRCSREPLDFSTPGALEGSKTAPASTIAAATAAVAADAAERKKLFSGSMKLPLSKIKQQQQQQAQSPIIAASALSSPPAITGPPSARLARSSSALLKPTPSSAGAQTARSAASGRTPLSRQSSASSLNSSPLSAAASKAAARRSAGSGLPLSPPSLTHAASTPSSAPNSAARRLFSPPSAAKPKTTPRTSAVASTTATGSAANSAASSRSRTPNVSAPATPKLRPSASPKASPTGTGRLVVGEELLKSKSASSRPATASAASAASRRKAGAAAASAAASSSPAYAAAASSPQPRRSVSDPQSSPSSSLLSSTVPSDDDEDEPDEFSTVLGGASAVTGETVFSATTLDSSAASAHAASPSLSAAMPSEVLFPKSQQPQEEECKEQPPSSGAAASTRRSASPPSAAVASVPPPKLLVLPLSSPKALAAFVEYVYSDGIVHTAAGDRSKRPAAAPATAAAASKKHAASPSKLRGSQHGLEWSDSEEEVAAAASAAASSAAAAARSSAAPMDVLDLLELACLASSLHDARLLCLCALHLQRALSPANIMSVLSVLDLTGALRHKAERDRAARAGTLHTVLSVSLNGSLHQPKSDHATHPTQGGKLGRPAASAAAAAAASMDGSASSSSSAASASASATTIPASFLLPDTPSSFLRTGSINLCGGSSHDLDLLCRLVLDYLLLNWTAIFRDGLGANMQQLHAMPFETFSLIVNLKNGGAAAAGASANGGAGSDGDGGSGSGGHSTPKEWVFKSVEEKAIFNQAQINAALIAAGIQPTHSHNLFHSYHLSGAGAPGSAEVMLMIALPSIALPACGLLKALKTLFAQRSEGSCDARLIIEDDSACVAPDRDRDRERERPAKHTLWAHKFVLAWGSEFFRSCFARDESAAARGAVGSQELHPITGRTVSTVRFPASGFSPTLLETVLRYIYYNDSRPLTASAAAAAAASPSRTAAAVSVAGGVDFGTALAAMNQHVTAYFGLREYAQGQALGGPSSLVAPSSSLQGGSAENMKKLPLVHAPASFSCDLEKSCIAILHAALNSTAAAGGAGSSGAAASVLAPNALEILDLIRSSFQYGDRSLFEKGCTLIDYAHLHLMMSAAMSRQRAEVQQQAQRGRGQRMHRRQQRQRSPVTAAAAAFGGASHTASRLLAAAHSPSLVPAAAAPSASSATAPSPSGSTALMAAPYSLSPDAAAADDDDRIFLHDTATPADVDADAATAAAVAAAEYAAGVDSLSDSALDDDDDETEEEEDDADLRDRRAAAFDFDERSAATAPFAHASTAASAAASSRSSFAAAVSSGPADPSAVVSSSSSGSLLELEFISAVIAEKARVGASGKCAAAVRT